MLLAMLLSTNGGAVEISVGQGVRHCHDAAAAVSEERSHIRVGSGQLLLAMSAHAWMLIFRTL